MSKTVAKLSPIQKAMAKHMQASWTEVPQFSVQCEVDCGALKAYRSRLGFKTSFTVLIVKAVSLTLKKHPHLNASWRPDGIAQYEQINIGVAMDTHKGLLVPVIPDASSAPLSDIHGYMEEYKRRAERGNFTVEQLSGGTFTISNLGMFPVSSFTAVVNAPQAAIIALARMEDRPVARRGKIELGTIMRATISVDHRVSDGASAARFLSDLSGVIEHPDAMA